MITNRKARFNFNIEKEYIAGIKLLGSEVKSLRDGRADMTDCFVYINNGEAFIKNLYIGKYMEATYMNHDELRERKLLLNRKEIDNLVYLQKGKNLTIIPLEIFLSKGLFKVKIALASGKKFYDKRETIKEREIKRKIDRGDYE